MMCSVHKGGGWVGAKLSKHEGGQTTDWCVSTLNHFTQKQPYKVTVGILSECNDSYWPLDGAFLHCSLHNWIQQTQPSLLYDINRCDAVGDVIHKPFKPLCSVICAVCIVWCYWTNSSHVSSCCGYLCLKGLIWVFSILCAYMRERHCVPAQWSITW